MKHTVLILTLSLATCTVLADRGVIVEKDVNLEEPAQRAIVIHNGTWQMLILQTDVIADQATKAVEFMPLPSKPDVSLAPDDCFRNLQWIVDKHKVKYIVLAPRHGPGGPSGKSEGIEVVAEHDLGPHHVTVVEI